MKNAFKILAVAAVAICFAFAMPAKESKVFNVVIDAAHGGKDFGAVHEGIMEKDIVRQVAGKLKDFNDDTEIKLHFVALPDEFVSLEERVNTINSLKADLVISIHVNSVAKSDASGMEFFVTDKPAHSAKSTELAEKLSEKFKGDDNFKVRKIAQAPFYILKNVNAPAVMFQIGFLTNEQDRAYMTNEQTQNTIAKKIIDFIKEVK